MACPRECEVALAAFVWLFSTVCFQMCSQIACPRRGKVTLVAFFLLFSTAHLQMACPRGCKVALAAFVFLHSACSNASSKRLHKKLHNHIDCICLTYLHCVFANVSSYVGMQSHNGCNYLTSLFCAFSNVSSNCLPENRHIHLAFSSVCF